MNLSSPLTVPYNRRSFYLETPFVSVLRNLHFLIFITRKGFEKTIYFSSRKTTIAICTYNEMYISCVSFLGDKKGPTKGFLS